VTDLGARLYRGRLVQQAQSPLLEPFRSLVGQLYAAANRTATSTAQMGADGRCGTRFSRGLDASQRSVPL